MRFGRFAFGLVLQFGVYVGEMEFLVELEVQIYMMKMIILYYFLQLILCNYKVYITFSKQALRGHILLMKKKQLK